VNPIAATQRNQVLVRDQGLLMQVLAKTQGILCTIPLDDIYLRPLRLRRLKVRLITMARPCFTSNTRTQTTFRIVLTLRGILV
jgi:hypothetical protein